MERNRDEKPMFESLDEMCRACGFDDATKEQIRRDMLLTQPRSKVSGKCWLTQPCDVNSETLQ